MTDALVDTPSDAFASDPLLEADVVIDDETNDSFVQKLVGLFGWCFQPSTASAWPKDDGSSPTGGLTMYRPLAFGVPAPNTDDSSLANLLSFAQHKWEEANPMHDYILSVLARIPSIDPDTFEPLGEMKRPSLVLGTIDGIGQVVRITPPEGWQRAAFEVVVAQLAVLQGSDASHYFVRLVGQSDDCAAVYVQYELCGDLRRFVGSNLHDDVDWATRCAIGHEVATALAWLHAHGTVHGNVSADNILLDAGLHAKLTGFFGVGGDRRDPYFEPANLALGAPEVLLNTHPGAPLTPAADVYQLGLVLVTLATHMSPYQQFPATTPWLGIAYAFRQAIESGEPLKMEPLHDAPKWYQDLVACCLSLDPRRRPSAAQVAYILTSGLSGSFGSVGPAVLQGLSLPPQVDEYVELRGVVPDPLEPDDIAALSAALRQRAIADVLLLRKVQSDARRIEQAGATKPARFLVLQTLVAAELQRVRAEAQVLQPEKNWGRTIIGEAIELVKQQDVDRQRNAP